MFTQFFKKASFLSIFLFIMFCLFAMLPTFPALADKGSTNATKVTLVFDRTIPNVPGKSIRGVLVEYAPGSSSPAHTHAASAFIYATVLEGSIRSQINDNSEQVYHAGENFVEEPGDHHVISANASNTQPMRMLAVFVVDTNEETLTIPDK